MKPIYRWVEAAQAWRLRRLNGTPRAPVWLRTYRAGMLRNGDGW